jgi:hypothetical protein
MNFTGSHFPRHAFAFKGGGGGTTVVQQATAPAAPAKPPVAIPPVTERTQEVEMASRQTKIDARKRRGLRATLLAGETGGFVSDNSMEQKKTLLG